MRWTRILAVTAILAAGTFVILYPFSVQFATMAPQRGADDALFGSETLWWQTESLLSGNLDHYFDNPIYFPMKNALAYSDYFPSSLPFFVPAYLLSQDPFFAHNLTVLLSYVVTGLCMYLFMLYVTRSFAAALLAGVMFAFLPSRINHLAHLNLMQMGVIPLVFLAFKAYCDAPGLKRAGLVALACWIMVLTNGQLLVFSIIPILIFLTAHAIGNRLLQRPEFYWQMLLAFVVLAAAAIPFLYPYLRFRDEMLFFRSTEQLDCAILKNYLGIDPSNRLWGRALKGNGSWERYLFNGVLPLMLGLIGAWRVRERDQRSLVVAMLIIIPIGVLLSLGPYLVDIGPGTRSIYYYLFHVLPGFDGIRVPARNVFYVYFAVCVLAGLGVQRVLRDTTGHWTVAITLLLLLGVVAESAHQVPVTPARNRPEDDAAYRMLATLPEGAVHEYPMPPGTGSSMGYAVTFHRHPTSNGYSSFFPFSYYDLDAAVTQLPVRWFFRMLQDTGIRYFLMRKKGANYEVYERYRRAGHRPPGVDHLAAFEGGARLFDTHAERTNWFESEVFSAAAMHLPSCALPGDVVAGGLVLTQAVPDFVVPSKMRYSTTALITAIDGGTVARHEVDLIAYRIYAPPNVRLIVRLPLPQTEGRYRVELPEYGTSADITVDALCGGGRVDRYAFEGIDLPTNVRSEDLIPITLRLHNTSDGTYRMTGAFTEIDLWRNGAMRIILTIIRQQDNKIALQMRIPLTSDLAPGDLGLVQETIPVNLAPDSYRIQVDLISEYRNLLSRLGNQPYVTDLVVEPAEKIRR